jgi:hypothetical protein
MGAAAASAFSLKAHAVIPTARYEAGGICFFCSIQDNHIKA